MIKISIIVPIYNVEKQLERCIKSLLTQEDKDLQTEIILVNDGSTDDSGKIAKEYALKYKDKIIYLEKENGGLSDARNYGMNYATGQYIAFVDSDDYISEELYPKLVKYMIDDYDLIKIKISKEQEKRNHVLYKKIEETFQGFFGSKVRLSPGKRRGKIVIVYTSNDDLERIMGLLK